MSSTPYTPISYVYLTTLSEMLAKHLHRSEATISAWITGHARLFSRLRSGQGCNAHTYQDALVWFSSNWPNDLEWPSDIPRPTPPQSTQEVSSC